MWRQKLKGGSSRCQEQYCGATQKQQFGQRRDRSSEWLFTDYFVCHNTQCFMLIPWSPACRPGRQICLNDIQRKARSSPRHRRHKWRDTSWAWCRKAGTARSRCRPSEALQSCSCIACSYRPERSRRPRCIIWIIKFFEDLNTFYITRT